MYDDRTLRLYPYTNENLFRVGLGGGRGDFPDDVRRTFPGREFMADFSKRKGCAKNRGKALLRAPPETYFRLDHFLTYRTLGGSL